MTNEEIKKLALQYGFTERQQADGSIGLNLYVYAFANAVADLTRKEERERCAKKCDDNALKLGAGLGNTALRVTAMDIRAGRV